MPSNEYMRIYMANRRAARRAKVEEILGGRCSWCGVESNLEIDHIDPFAKKFRISGRGLDKPWEMILEEAAKCQLLCNRCHIEKTVAERPKSEHGTENHYQKYRCRCVKCREGYAARRKRYPSRARKPALI